MLRQIWTGSCFAITLLICGEQSPAADTNWPQAAGPNATWRVEGNAATKWSVVRNENISWRTTLPEGGQSAVTVWGDRLFLTCHRPLSSINESSTSMDIDGYCLSATTGDILWKVPLPGSVAVGTAGIFSDATVFAPVTDGSHVWFFNRSGSIGCYDFDGRQIWLREYSPRNRHTNRECEPFLVGDQLVTVEVLDKAAGRRMERHAKVPADIDERSVWTYLHGISKQTGQVVWTGKTGTVCHHAPIPGRLSNGQLAIVNARGGGHGPLEKPYGLTMTSLEPGWEGSEIWSTELQGFDPSFNGHWDKNHVVAFHGKDHVVFDSNSGKELRRVSLHENVKLWSLNSQTRTWTGRKTTVKAGRRHANTNQSNIVVEDWHYFLAHDINAIGRVNVETSAVEYLEVPVQIDAGVDGNDRWITNRRQAVPLKAINSRGLKIAQDKRASGTGWGHVSAASPTCVGRYLYFPVMSGTTYVIDTESEHLDGSSLIAINDLGPAGDVWTLSSFSYADEALFIRTMTEVIRIE